MPFTQSVKDAAYRRAGGKCECRRSTCTHIGRCLRPLSLGWDAHHIVSQDAGGSDALANCEALCLTCHKNTLSYGRY
jgi:5-methylcytosine-specific restriction endonuclease McrA